MDIKLGQGTKVTREPAEIQEGQAWGRQRTWVVTQTIRLVCSFSTVYCNSWQACSRCKILFPDVPPVSAGEYILANSDHGRVLSPITEDQAEEFPERDSFPVPGWRSIDGGRLCPGCFKEFQEFMSRER